MKQIIIHDIVKQIDAPIIQPSEQASSITANNDIDAIRTWLLEFRNSPNTFISYRQTAERFVIWLMQQHLNLRQVTREIIQNYEDFFN